MDKRIKPLSIATGALFAVSLAGAAHATAGANPFTLTALDGGYRLADSSEAKCGGNKDAEAKCGADKKTAESACGADKKAAESKCGADGKAKAEEDTKIREAKCGEAKCGGSK